MVAVPTHEAVKTEPTGLTEFLDAYRRDYPDEVVHVTRPVDRRRGLTAILDFEFATPDARAPRAPRPSPRP